jgi:hypothetical protein
MSNSKPPELGVWGPEVLQQIVDLVLPPIEALKPTALGMQCARITLHQQTVFFRRQPQLTATPIGEFKCHIVGGCRRTRSTPNILTFGHNQGGLRQKWGGSIPRVFLILLKQKYDEQGAEKTKNDKRKYRHEQLNPHNMNFFEKVEYRSWQT